MKWYDWVITKFQSYKWYLFSLFVILFVWLVLNDAVFHVNAYVPGFGFVGLLIVWIIIWVIADYLHKKK